MNEHFTDPEIAQLHADLDAATPMTRTDKAFVLTGIALCIGALVVGAKVAGLV